MSFCKILFRFFIIYVICSYKIAKTGRGS